MFKLTIDRSEWLNEKTANWKTIGSCLFDSKQNRMCCIGIYLNQLGMEKNSLEYFGGPGSIFSIPVEAKWLKGAPFDTSVTCNLLMRTNDKKYDTEEEREDEITRLFLTENIEVEFVGELQ